MLNHKNIILLLSVLLLFSCNDFLNEKPSKNTSLQVTTAEQLDYLLNSYNSFYQETSRTLIMSTDDYGLQKELYEAKNISDKDIVARLEEIGVEVPRGKKQKLNLFTQMYINLVDDEGVQNDMGEPYVINGDYYCCSLALEENAKNNLECEICGTEYEIE